LWLGLVIKKNKNKEENIVVNLADQFRHSALEELDSMLEECFTLYEAVSIKTC
jgi:hypothetical protein